MSMVIPGIDEAQGSEGLIVSRGRYTVKFLNARDMEVDNDDSAKEPGEPVANRVTISYEIIEAPSDAVAYDRETQEPDESMLPLEGKTIEQSIYVMTENHVKFESAGRYGRNELKDVIRGFGVPTVDDEIQWEQAEGRFASVSIKPEFREVGETTYVSNKFRGWRQVE